MQHEFTIAEDQRQLLLLALALMVTGPRPGFDYAAVLVADALHGREIFEHLKEIVANETDSRGRLPPARRGAP